MKINILKIKENILYNIFLLLLLKETNILYIYVINLDKIFFKMGWRKTYLNIIFRIKFTIRN